jgi:hypothetical protein
MAQYRVLAGIDYPPNKRVEIGDLVSDLPTSAIKNLLDIGAIESTDKKIEIPASEPVEEESTTTEEAGE